MTDKRCLIYETLGKVSDLEIVESKGSNGMRLHGVFGVCGIKNQNNRVYDKENYKQMVESLQKVIKESGCPGELEHPNSMNINLQNVSHKIESIQMNEDGTITGDILLLNTPSGKIAQAIVEGGLPLYISSRGAGTITNEGRVTLSTIKTYDLVGTPGFSQAKLTLKENQTLECLNEGLEDGNNETWVIVEGDDDLLSDDDNKDKDNDKPKDEPKGENEDSKDKDKEDDKPKDKDNDKEDNKNNGNNDTDMEKLREAVEELTKKVESLEAELHVAKESLEETKESKKPINYETIETWIKEEFAPTFKEEISNEIKESITEDVDQKITEAVNNSIETISEGVENWINEEYNPEVQKWVNEEFAPIVQQWVVEEFAPEVQNWVVEEFAPEVQNWVVEEFSPEVQNWVVEEFSPEVQNWIVEEFSPEIQGWITEEFAPVVEGWITEEFAPENSKAIEDKVNENVNAFIESQKAGRLEEIDSLLESIEQNGNSSVEKIVAEESKNNKYKGVYVVENMPAEYRPSWETLTEARQQEIIRSSRMYDFMKEGQLDKFWANVDFNQTNPVYVNESKENPMEAYQSSIVARMKALRRTF